MELVITSRRCRWSPDEEPIAGPPEKLLPLLPLDAAQGRRPQKRIRGNRRGNRGAHLVARSGSGCPSAGSSCACRKSNFGVMTRYTDADPRAVWVHRRGGASLRRSTRSGICARACNRGEAKRPTADEFSYAARRYSWIRPPSRSRRRSRSSRGTSLGTGPSPAAVSASGGRWRSERCGLCSL